MYYFVIPAKAGIQHFQLVVTTMDSITCPEPRSGVHRSDDFLQEHQRLTAS